VMDRVDINTLQQSAPAAADAPDSKVKEIPK